MATLNVFVEDHKPLAGITVGDIGPKAGGGKGIFTQVTSSNVFASGAAAQDQGFARFDHVRIPRTNMFSKFAEVTTEGIYIKPPHAKLSYGGVKSLSRPDIDITDDMPDDVHQGKVCQ